MGAEEQHSHLAAHGADNPGVPSRHRRTGRFKAGDISFVRSGFVAAWSELSPTE